jgi:hypothetical protein
MALRVELRRLRDSVARRLTAVKVSLASFRARVTQWRHRGVWRGRRALNGIRQAARSTRLLLFLFAASVVIWIWVPSLPRAAVFESPTSLVSLLSTIAASLAAIVAIVVAVLLVALEILRATYAGHALRELLRTGELRRLLTLYLFTVGLALLTLATVGNTIQSRTVGLTYLVGFLTAVCLGALYPSVKGMLAGTATNRERISSIGATLDFRAVHRVAQIRRYPLTEELVVLEDHPLFVLSEIAIRSIGDGDRIVPRLVVHEAGSRLLELLKQMTESSSIDQSRDVMNSFLLVFRPTARAATKHRDELTTEAVIRVMEDIHVAAAEWHTPWHCFIEFDECLQEIATQAAASGMETSSRTACWAVQTILEAHLRHNVPEEKDVWMLNLKKGEAAPQEPDHEKGLQWENVSRRYVDMLVAITEAGIESRLAGIVTTGLMSLGRLVEAVSRLENLGLRQKEDVIRWCHYHARTLAVRAAKELGTAPTLALYAFNELRTADALDKDLPWAKTGILQHCSALIRLAEMKALNRFSLNDLGTLGRHSIDELQKHGSPRHAEAVILICDTLTQIAGAYTPPSTTDDVLVLREVDSQLESFDRWFAAKQVTHEAAQTSVAEARARLRAIAVPDRFEKIEKIPWPTLPAG